MPSARLFAAALIACAFGPAVGSAAAQPPFPLRYHGAISGTFFERDSSDGVSTTTASWKITGVGLRRTRVTKSDAAWSADYAVTSGKVTYQQVADAVGLEYTPLDQVTVPA